MFSNYSRFAVGVQQLLQGDTIILMLLIVISLFSTDKTVVNQKPSVSSFDVTSWSQPETISEFL